MYQNFIIPYLYAAQHVLGDTPPIIRSLKLQWQPLVLHTWKVVGRVVGGCCQAHYAWQHPPTTRPTTFHVWKTRGCHCSFRLLMMGGVSPETCWASYKYGIINFDTLLHLVGFFCVNCIMSSALMQQRMVDFHTYWLQHLKTPIHSTQRDADHSPPSNGSATCPDPHNYNMVLRTVNLNVRDHNVDSNIVMAIQYDRRN